MQVNMQMGIGRTGTMNASAISRGTAAQGTQKQSFAAKLGGAVGGIAKGVAQVGLGVVSNAIPGGGILANALGGAFGNNLAGGGIGSSTAGLSAGGDTMMKDMMKMNMEFMALQNATQNESRKFQTLSNASRARHDVAMNAIRNMKA
jgi:hypothetical protein